MNNGAKCKVQCIQTSSQIKMGVLNTQSICNKVAGVLELLSDKNIDICFATETWLKVDDKAKFAEIRDHGYDIFSAPRRGRGGGVAFIFRPNHVRLIRNNVSQYLSFEVLEAVFKSSSSSELYRLAVIYRSTQTKTKKKYAETRQVQFFQEFLEYLDLLSTKSGKPIICGDFNFHIEDSVNIAANKFKSVIYSKGFIQHNNRPTYGSTSILDLVLTHDSITDHVAINDIGIIRDTPSDHCMVQFVIPVESTHLNSTGTTVTTKDIRQLAKINIDKFKQDIASYMPSVQSLNSLDDAVSTYDNVLTTLLDKHAPCKSTTFREGKNPWWSAKCQEARSARRKAERNYRHERDKNGIKSPHTQHCHQLYKELQVESAIILTRERNRYYSSKLASVSGDAKATYKVLNKLLDKKYGSDKLPNGDSDSAVANSLKSFFHGKVQTIYEGIESDLQTLTSHDIPDPISTEHNASYFKFMTNEDVAEIIQTMGSKSCEADPIPTWLFKNCLSELLPTVTLIVNASLQSGVFPDQMKTAIVRATLKKPHLDSDDLKNFRPISNLTFLSKVIEKCVHKQLTDYVTASDLFAEFQSGYRKAHSCETAVLKIHNDILIMVDQRKHVVLMLLDLSAAFDTINHKLLIKKLKKSYGLDGCIIKWIKSYLANRTFSVVVNGIRSESSRLEIGVPQGSILGPLLFILYTKELEHIAAKYDFLIHLYADDSQLYLSFDPQKDDHTDQLRKLKLCFNEIKQWMTANFLKMNDTKTEIMEIHGLHPRATLQPSFNLGLDDNIKPTLSAKNLGFFFDSKLSLDAQLNHVSKVCYMNLRNIGRIGLHLSKELKIQLIHSSILSILDNGNAAYSAITSTQLNNLQKIQNAAVRFIFGLNGKKRRQSITPYLKELHFLPVYFRILFKIALLVFKSLNNIAPKYIADMLNLRQINTHGVRANNDNFLLIVPPTPRYVRTIAAFSYSAPTTWNSLPYGIRCMSDVNAFKIALKTHYYRHAFRNMDMSYDDIDLMI